MKSSRSSEHRFAAANAHAKMRSTTKTTMTAKTRSIWTLTVPSFSHGSDGSLVHSTYISRQGLLDTRMIRPPWLQRRGYFSMTKGHGAASRDLEHPAPLVDLQKQCWTSQNRYDCHARRVLSLVDSPRPGQSPGSPTGTPGRLLQR